MIEGQVSIFDLGTIEDIPVVVAPKQKKVKKEELPFVQLDIFDAFKALEMEEIRLTPLDAVKRAFEELQLHSKELFNPTSICVENLSNEARELIPRFVQEGWCKLHPQNENILFIQDDFILHNTMDEFLSSYRRLWEKALENPDFCWYKNGLNLRNFFNVRFKTQDERKEFYTLQKQITKEFAFKLGLKHWKEKPSSRGSRMDMFGKWAKKHLKPKIADDILGKDMDFIEAYFEKNSFYMGRSDEKSSDSCFTPPAYPNIRKLMVTEFEIACLAQATANKEIFEILDYCGGAMGYRNKSETAKQAIYPDGMSYETYLRSLTKEDLERIEQDRQRLTRLHGRDTMAEFMQTLKEDLKDLRSKERNEE